jgi:hypothetical protein
MFLYLFHVGTKSRFNHDLEQLFGFAIQISLPCVRGFDEFVVLGEPFEVSRRHDSMHIESVTSGLLYFIQVSSRFLG